MAKSKIQIADNFALDLHSHLIDRGLAILGMRGSGKSWTAGVVAEELASKGIPFIVIDLMGEYYSLREKFPVLIAALGTPKYADIKGVTPDQAGAIAESVVKSGISLILDLKYGTMLERFAFLAPFLEALYHTEESLKRPLVLIIDEAHRITPEKGVIKLREVQKFQRKVEYWVYETGATGRHYGIGFVVVARRVAEISKMTLTQCELKLALRVVDPVDLERLREYGLPTEILNQVKRFKPGDAVVIGLEEPRIIHVKQRICSHGARTPLAKPVETPDLAKAVKELAKLLKAPRVQIPPDRIRREELKEIQGELEARREQVERMENTISSLKREILALQDERERLRARIKELESQVLTAEDRLKYEARIKALESTIGSLKEQVSKAAELETQLENLRELFADWKDLIIETYSVLGLELIPSDIQALIRERNRLKEKLEVYEREEALKNELVQQTLNNPAVRSWIQDAESLLRNLMRRGQAGAVILKAALRIDPEVSFLPEEIETGYTVGTNLNYLNMLVGRGLLWESRKKGRKAFRNRLYQWVAENVRKIMPSAPDEAVNQIAEHLKSLVVK